MERIGLPSPRFANRGVHNICLGPKSKTEALRGERVVVAIFNKQDLVVRELRQEFVDDEGNVYQKADPKQAMKSRIVDVDLTGHQTVLHENAEELFGTVKAWVTLLDKWSRTYGVTQ